MAGQPCLDLLQHLVLTPPQVKLSQASFNITFEMTSSSYVTTESGDRQNVFPIEAQPELVENYSGYIQEAEKANGRWAMIGFIALLGSYVSTGQVLPGIF